MVTRSRAPGGIYGFRSLNTPLPLVVEATAEGWPLAVTLRGRRVPVRKVQDCWRIDDEWWRETPVRRLYWRLALADDRITTVFQDLLEKTWCRQNY